MKPTRFRSKDSDFLDAFRLFDRYRESIDLPYSTAGSSGYLESPECRQIFSGTIRVAAYSIVVVSEVTVLATFCNDLSALELDAPRQVLRDMKISPAHDGC
jgi:hypothetical protein